MTRVEATERRDIHEADNIDKNSKSHKLPSHAMERRYLADRGTKPSFRYCLCAKCGHVLVDEPPFNKDVDRKDKQVEEKWNADRIVLENYNKTGLNPLLDSKGAIITKLRNPTYGDKVIMCHCWQNFQSAFVGGSGCLLSCYDSKTKIQYEAGKCPVCICSCSFVCTMNSYSQKKQCFDLERSKGTMSKPVAEASANNLLNNAARVRTMVVDDSYDYQRKQKEEGNLSSSVPDAILRNTAASEGWLAQANHLLHQGVTSSQYLEFEHAVRTVEQQHGGATKTKKYGNLSEARSAKQRARNTRLSDVDGVVSGGNAGGGGRANVIDLVAGLTPRDPCPENWPFHPSSPQSKIESMVTRTRARATKRMTDKSLAESARKETYIVRTKLVNKDEDYVSIIKDILPEAGSQGKPGSQDMLDVMSTQASMEMKMKK